MFLVFSFFFFLFYEYQRDLIAGIAECAETLLLYFVGGRCEFSLALIFHKITIRAGAVVLGAVWSAVSFLQLFLPSLCPPRPDPIYPYVRRVSRFETFT